MNEHHKQAQDFMEKTGLKISVKFKSFGKYFADDKEERDIYDVTFTRDPRSYTFTFGQSIVNSGTFELPGKMGIPLKVSRTPQDTLVTPWKRKRPVEPVPYDILACLQTVNPGTFADFCADFGYDTDSRKAEKTYRAVVDEYLQLSSMFSEQEMEELSAIC